MKKTVITMEEETEVGETSRPSHKKLGVDRQLTWWSINC